MRRAQHLSPQLCLEGSVVASKAFFALSVSNFNLSGHSTGRTPMGAPKATKRDYDNIRYFNTKPRDKWDYDRIDEQINQSSEFRDKTNREQFFEGPRKDNSNLNSGGMHTPHHYRLYEYFDEYTKPGVNKKVAAALAVEEQWKKTEQFPSETFVKDRPGFRSVPKEILHRNTYYSHFLMLDNAEKVWTEHRPRAWCPHWPPPGYKMQRMQCKKEFTFGVEEVSLVAEIERFNWYKAWQETNTRLGWRECLAVVTNGISFIWFQRNHGELTVMRAHMSGMMYPGRFFIRSNGTPKDWETGSFWFQKPLKEFPIYAQRMGEAQRSYWRGYIDYTRKQELAASMGK